MTVARKFGPRMIAAVLLLAAYGLIAFGSGMDRLSAADPSRASLVPAFLRTDAAEADALVALAKSENRQAELYSGEALRAAPRDHRSAGILASALILQGDTSGGRRAMEVSRSIGWRDPVAQAYWSNDGLREGDSEAAVAHYEALLRTQPNLPLGDQLLAAIASNRDARLALIDRAIAHEPFARELFAVDSNDLSTAVALRGDLLLDEAMEAQPYGCSIAGSVIEGLAERQMSEEADALAARHCPI